MMPMASRRMTVVLHAPGGRRRNDKQTKSTDKGPEDGPNMEQIHSKILQGDAAKKCEPFNGFSDAA